MGPSLARHKGEGLLVAEDWPAVLVEEVGLVGGGLERRTDRVALLSLTGNSLVQGS